MVKIKKIFLIGIVALILVQTVYSLNVGLLVDFPSGVVTECVHVPDEATGKDALDASSFSVQYTSYPGMGEFIDTINGIPSDYASSWSLWQNDGGNFELTPGGITDLIIDKSGIILGFKYPGWSPSWDPISPSSFIPYENICKMLKVTEVKAYVDDDKESGVDEDGGKIDVRPGSELRLEIEISNLYPKIEDVDIGNVYVTATIDDIDDGDDLEDESKEYQIGAGEEEDIELLFHIPLSVENDKYDMTLKLEGDDSFGWDYKETIEFEVEVEKENHELMILDEELSPSVLRCDRATELSFKVMNLGTNDEPIHIKIENPNLGLSATESVELSEDPDDDDNTLEKVLGFLVSQEVRAGTYPISITAEYDDEEETETVNLKIEDCETYEKTVNVVEYQGFTGRGKT